MLSDDDRGEEKEGEEEEEEAEEEEEEAFLRKALGGAAPVTPMVKRKSTQLEHLPRECVHTARTFGSFIH